MVTYSGPAAIFVRTSKYGTTAVAHIRDIYRTYILGKCKTSFFQIAGG